MPWSNWPRWLRKWVSPWPSSRCTRAVRPSLPSLPRLTKSSILLDAIADPQVKIVLDTYHLGLDATLIQRIPEIVPRIAIVQLGDARQPPKGEQEPLPARGRGGPLGRDRRCPIAAGYDGFYDVELLGEEIETSDYHSLLQHAKEAFARLVSHRA